MKGDLAVGDKWVNEGDVNFLVYGGSLVRHHWDEEEIKTYPTLQNQYDVFYYDPDQGIAALCLVDLDDLSCEMFDDIKYTNGLENETANPWANCPERLAVEWVEYCGPGAFSNSSFKSQYPFELEDYLISEEELEKWLNDLEVKSEVIGGYSHDQAVTLAERCEQSAEAARNMAEEPDINAPDKSPLAK